VSRIKGRLTLGWTDRHVAVAVAVVAAGITGVLTRDERAPFHLVVGIALVVTVWLALSLNVFGGMAAGVAAAAGVIAVKQWSGAWDEDVFLGSVESTLGLVVVGGLVGMAGSRLRGRGVVDGPGPAPAYGSLGLLTAEVALSRLDEEIARARHHARPLTVVLIRTDTTDQTLSQGARLRAHRTVARLLESLLRETDVPFALTTDEVGAILPETNAETAWQLVGPLMDAATRASFTVREEDQRRSLADCAELHAGLVSLSEDCADADELMAAARQSVREDKASPLGPEASTPTRRAR
jgi:GGDEF domain-containing protein